MKISEMVFEFLKDQGLCPKYDDDGDIFFKYQMAGFVYIVDDDDELFFRLAMPNIFEVTDDNRMMVLEAINKVNVDVKVVKAICTPVDNVWLTTEMLMDTTPNLEDFFQRNLHILLGARVRFTEAISE